MTAPSVGIMQPYFFPYIGYWQLISHVDTFVVYDSVQYTKRGWINRNRFLSESGPITFSLPLEQASSTAEVRQRRLAPEYEAVSAKLLRQLENAYRDARYRDETLELVHKCLSHSGRNLFDFIFNSICMVASHLNLETRIICSSSLTYDAGLSGEARVIAICKTLQAGKYVNPEAGRSLYSTYRFAESGIALRFLTPNLKSYPQGCREFVGSMSIIDVLMHLGSDAVIQEGYLDTHVGA